MTSIPLFVLAALVAGCAARPAALLGRKTVIKDGVVYAGTSDAPG